MIRLPLAAGAGAAAGVPRAQRRDAGSSREGILA
jgi:hypothetical protein